MKLAALHGSTAWHFADHVYAMGCSVDQRMPNLMVNPKLPIAAMFEGQNNLPFGTKLVHGCINKN